MSTVRSFTYSQAQEIAEDFEDLIDTEYGRAGVRFVIDDVIIRPYELVKQHEHLEDYYAAEDIQVETDEDTVALYAVLVVMSSLSDGSVLVQDITEYVAANGVNYNFPN